MNIKSRIEKLEGFVPGGLCACPGMGLAVTWKSAKGMEHLYADDSCEPCGSCGKERQRIIVEFVGVETPADSLGRRV